MFAALALGHFLLALLFTLAGNGLALIPWRRSAGLHWAERARLLYPARVSSSANIILVPMILALAQAIFLPELPWQALWTALTGLPGASLGSYPVSRAMYPGYTFGSWLRDVITGLIFQAGPLAVFVTACASMPRDGWDWRAIVIPLAVVVLQLWFIFGGFIGLARIVRAAEPASERCRLIVGRVAARLQRPLPRVWELHGPVANAFAMPATQTLLITQALLAALSDEEAETIIAHEFGHLGESRGTLLVRILIAMRLLPYLFLGPLAHSVGFWWAFLSLTAGSFLLKRLAGVFSRRMEREADAVASQPGEEAAGTYARALARIHEVNHLPAVFPKTLATHPHLYDRMLAAGVTPDFPRPKPPKQRSWSTGLLALAFVGLAAFAGYENRFPSLFPSHRKHPHPARHFSPAHSPLTEP
jgi:Zn-dependent protease with chaperone function